MPRAPRPRRSRATLRVEMLSLTGLAAGTLIAFKTLAQVRVGPGWDSYAFLVNAAEFAGKGVGYTELHRPPFLSFLVSLVFRFTARNAAVVQWADAALSLAAIVAFYLLLLRRFSAPKAATGALALLAFPPLWDYIGTGYTDFASVGLSMWALVFLTKATEEDSRWYLAAAPVFVLAVLTRYTALLFAFPMLLWLVFRARPFRDAGRIGGAIALAIATYVPAGVFYHRRFADMLFPFAVALGAVQDTSAVTPVTAAGLLGTGFAAQAKSLAALVLPSPVSPLAWLIVVGAAAGLISRVLPPNRSRLPWSRILLSAAAVAGLGYGLVKGGLFAGQFLIPIVIYLVWRWVGPRDLDGADPRTPRGTALAGVMIAWALAYADFHALDLFRVPRYVIMVAPTLVFLCLLGWDSWSKTLGDPRARTAGGAHRSTAAVWLSAPLVALVLASVALNAAHTSRTPDYLVAGARSTARWLVKHDPGVSSETVYSDLWPLTSWYLGSAARPMPFFTNLTAFDHELDKNAAAYYVTTRSKPFKGYDAVDAAQGVTVLRRRPGARPRPLPRVLYLGRSWQNYLERLTGYGIYLDFDAGQYGWVGTAYLDAFTPEQLARYPVVAAYGVRWHERDRIEGLLARYVRDGGSLILDASRNMGDPPFVLSDTILFGTLIRRGGVEPDAPLTVAPWFVERHPGLGRIAAAPFVDEGGGRWFGALYEPVRVTTPVRVLARIAGKPAILMQPLGKGRIYWIGYNLVWHAQLTDNRSEMRLVRAIVEDALSRETTPSP
ncbi:MAG: glycosyltransferase family 39 protein [Coriobacteriia bacterium]